MIWSTFGKYLKPYKAFCIIGPLAKLTEAVLELYLPLLMARVIDNGVLTRDTAYLWQMGAVMLGIVAAGLCSALVCQYMASRTSQGFGTQLRDALFCHITRFSYADLDKFGTPSLINRVTADINQMQVAVAMLIRLVIRAPFLCIGGIIMAFFIDWQLALVILAVIPVLCLVLWLISRKTVKLYRAVQTKFDRMTLLARENLSGVRVIRAFARTDKEQQRFDDAATNHADAAVRVGRIAALMSPLTMLVMNTAIVGILWFGGYRVESGGVTTGEIIAFINYVNQILVALTVVANLVTIFSKAYASAQRVAEVLHTEPSVRDGAGEQPQTAQTAVSFRQADFSYGGSRALSDITFDVPHGATVGVIGGTGAGKTTLVGLIGRFYDVTDGAVLVDGRDVRDYPLTELRRKIGMVPQRVELFEGSIADNLRWGDADATEEQLWAACDAAQATDFIKQKSGGMNALVGRGGSGLSGGQRQRLAVARALVRQPEILILDDAASALDYETEAALRRALRDNGATTFIISQRVGSVTHADLIVVLDDGELAGVGTHEQLLKDCEAYREIVRSQHTDEEVGA